MADILSLGRVPYDKVYIAPGGWAFVGRRVLPVFATHALETVHGLTVVTWVLTDATTETLYDGRPNKGYEFAKHEKSMIRSTVVAALIVGENMVEMNGMPVLRSTVNPNYAPIAVAM